MLHYHGTPITPKRELLTLGGKCFCVSFARPDNIKIVHSIGQSVLLDNGAFSVWRRNITPNWPGYYAWADKWLDYRTTWAVIPDVIDGEEEDNDRLLRQWPHKERGAPVWHLHESVDRLLKLCDTHEKVCFGSSGIFGRPKTPLWHRRVEEAFNAVAARHRVMPWIHMLRGMALSDSEYPFSSVDSTDVARNHKERKDRGISALDMANRWDAMQCPSSWVPSGFRRKLSRLEETVVYATESRRAWNE